MRARPFLFEVSWEIANKVSDLYTILASKSALIKEEYNDYYFLIGPYFADVSESRFIRRQPPEFLQRARNDLAAEGLRFHYGTWLLDSEPQVILIEFTNELAQLAQFKTWLWDTHRVDSLFAGSDFEEPLAFSWAAGKLIESIRHMGVKRECIIVHAHEWAAGAALLYAQAAGLDCSTVFTVHTTGVGRSLALAGATFGENIDSIDEGWVAADPGVTGRHTLEKAVALNADVFTTTSEVTTKEAGAFYGRKPDVVLPNGLDLMEFPRMQEIDNAHHKNRTKLDEFVQYYFFPRYSFDLDKTLFFITAGRYAFHEKGIDLLIDALSALNQRLKEEDSDTTIVAMLFMPAANSGVSDQVIENKFRHQQIMQIIGKEAEKVLNRIARAYGGEHAFDSEWILGKEFLEQVPVNQRRLKRGGNPPLVTHDLPDADRDAILSAFKQKELLNAAGDRVKVVFYPAQLSGGDGLLDMQLFDVMAGADLGVFPSLYEPWDYAQLEAGALGLPLITSDLSGYGRALKRIGADNGANKKLSGTNVMNRDASNYEVQLKELSSILYRHAMLEDAERLQLRLHAQTLAKNFDWRLLMKYYFQAYAFAVGGTKLGAA
ncbi:MAG TPA: glycosyltransferase [Candidatus Aquicultor sp.]|jgi:glycogen(starch) synthase